MHLVGGGERGKEYGSECTCMCIIERNEGRNIREMARNDITPPMQLIKQGFYAFILVNDNYFSKKR